MAYMHGRFSHVDNKGFCLLSTTIYSDNDLAIFFILKKARDFLNFPNMETRDSTNEETSLIFYLLITNFNLYVCSILIHESINDNKLILGHCSICL